MDNTERSGSPKMRSSDDIGEKMQKIVVQSQAFSQA